MLDFFTSQSAHDTCQSYCPEFVYDYFKNKGFWDHLFQHGFCEQLTNNELLQSACEFVQEHPYTSAIASAAVLLGTGTGAVIGLKSLIDGRLEQKARDEITIVRNDKPEAVIGVVHDDIEDDIDSIKDDALLSTPVVIATPLDNPKNLPVATILNKVFDYLKLKTAEHHSNLAAELDIYASNIAKFKQFTGFPNAKSLFQLHVVINPSNRSKALRLLGLPEDGSYPNDDTHYQVLAKTIGMPSAEEDKGHRIKVII